MAGQTSEQEGRQIMEWYESSEANRNTFLRERRIFDAMLLHGDESSIARKRISPRLRQIAIWAAQVAAIAAIVIGVGISTHFFTSDEDRQLMSVISVPAGQRADITLPDGSKVCLNALSSLSYPASFSAENREVTLSGQAFFEVTHDEESPFTVHAGDYNVRVLGTEFDVEAYPGSDEFCTTLVSGSVSVSVSDRTDTGNTADVILQPNEKAYLKNGRLAVEQVDDLSSLRWREGLVCFHNETFRDIMKVFEKYYGVTIEIAPSLTDTNTYSGKFRQSDGLDYALRVLQRDLGFDYERDEDRPIYRIR